jgi:hypothetical protein
MKKIMVLVSIVIGFIFSEQNLNAKTINQKCEIIKKHPFSNQDKDDTFKLIYNCKNLEDTMSFQIIGFSGNIIYDRKFTGKSFYDYGRPWYEYVTDPKRGRDFDPQKLSSHIADSLHKEDMLYIRKRMDDFFNDKWFVTNPVMKLDKKMLNEFHYDGIQGDSSVVGFAVHLFSEGFEMIAYSKKQKEVQVIASSD